MSIVVDLNWVASGKEAAYAEYHFQAYDDTTIINIDSIIRQFSDNVLKVKSLSIDIDSFWSQVGNSIAATIYFDGRPFNVTSNFKISITDEKVITILKNSPPLILRFYTVDLFEGWREKPRLNTILSSEPGRTDYALQFTNFNGVWTWYPSNPAPFNVRQDVSIPIKVRNANPFRGGAFMITKFETGAVKFNLFWGNSAANCNVPVRRENNAAGVSGNQYTNFALEQLNSAPYSTLGVYGVYRQFPLDAITSGPLSSPQTNFRGCRIAAMWPRGEIWIKAVPLIPVDANIYSTTLSLTVY